MSEEQSPEEFAPVEAPVAEESANEPDEVTSVTGIDVVDEVLASLTTLDGAGLSHHVTVFERAHAGLRAALDDRG